MLTPDQNSSILTSVKKLLGITPEYDAFDSDVVMHINSAFATLHQLGVGPEDGFAIEDESSKWQEFIDDSRYNSVKTYVFIKVKLMFDPPATSFALEALNKQAVEIEWRLNVVYENDIWGEVNP